MKKIILLMAVFSSLGLQPLQVYAQAPAELNADLREAIAALPIDGFRDVADGLLKRLQKYSPDGYSSKQGPFSLHVFLSGGSQAVIVAIDGSIGLPDDWLDETLTEQLASTRLKDPMFVLSLKNGVIQTRDMSPTLQAIMRDSYFNAPGLDVKRGMQVIARAGIVGVLGTVINNGMGVPVRDFILSVGKLSRWNALPSQATGGSSNSDSTSDADEARFLLKQAKNRQDKKAAMAAAKAKGLQKPPKDPPDYFVQFQTAPGTVIKGPLGMSPITLSDATIFVSSLGTMGYKGRVIVSGLEKKPFLGFFEAPYDAQGALKLTDFKFGLATPSLNLAEIAIVSQAFATPGGNFLPKVASLKAPLAATARPLSAFELENPNKLPEYRFGDPKTPFPGIEFFNLALLGPFAQETLGGKVVKGPYLKVIGNATVLGQKMGMMNVNLSEHGLLGDARGSIPLDLSAVGMGKPGVASTAMVHVDEKMQAVGLAGEFNFLGAGRKVSFDLGRDGITLESPASCVAPVDVKAKMAYAGFNFAGLPLDAVKPDARTLANCGAQALKDGAVWLGKQTFKGAKEMAKGLEEGAGAVGGAVVDGGKVVGKAGEDAAKASAQAAQDAAKATEHAASAAATAAASAASNAANQAGRAATEAAQQAVHAASNAVAAVGSAFGGGGTKTCNQRIGWLRERGNVPTPQSIDAFVNQVYLPLKVAAGKAQGIVPHLTAYELNVAKASDAFDAMTGLWNGKVPSKRVNAFQKVAYKAPKLELQGVAFLLEANAKEFNDWVGFRRYVDGWDNGHRPEGEALWQRCASVHVANIPTRMAGNWKTWLPPAHKGQIDAMFYGSPEYAKVKQGLANYIQQKNAQVDGYTNQMAAFASNWATRAGQARGELLRRMEEEAWPQAREMALSVETRARLDPLWKEYRAAIDAFQARSLAMLAVENAPTRDEAVRLVDRVVIAGAALNKAAEAAGAKAPPVVASEAVAPPPAATPSPAPAPATQKAPPGSGMANRVANSMKKAVQKN